MKTVTSISAIVSLIAGLITIIQFLGYSPALDANLPLFLISVGPWEFLVVSGLLSMYGLIGLSYLVVRYYHTRRIHLKWQEVENRVQWLMGLVSVPFLLFWMRATLYMLSVSISTEAPSFPLLEPVLWLVALVFTGLVLMFCSVTRLFHAVGDDLYEALE